MSYGEKMIDALQSQQLEESQKYFEQALKSDSEEELFILADSLYQLGFLQETKSIILQLLKNNPDNDELKINLAEIEIEENEIETALDLLLEIKETSDAYPQSLLVQADLYYIQGLHEVSEQKLLRAQELLGDEPAIQFALAELYFAVGNYPQAIKLYEDLIIAGYNELSGVNLAARCGGAYSAIGKFDEAIDYLKESLDENEHVDTLFQLGFTYLQKKEYQRANETLFKLKELDPNYTSLYPYLAKGLEEELLVDKAFEVIQEGLQYDQVNPDLFMQAAALSLKLNNEKAAEEHYQKAIQLAPENANYIISYTNLLLKQERFVETKNILDQSLKEEVEPQFYWNLALANEGLEDYEAAGEGYAKAYPGFRNNKDFLRSYISYLREEGNRTTIKDALADYLLLEPADEEMLQLAESINGNY